MSALNCVVYQACDAKMSSKATFYCLQCSSLQCVLCEKELHQNPENTIHERLSLDETGEYCSLDRQHPAVFYCPTCASSFCYRCYVNKHQHADARVHKPQKSKGEQSVTVVKNNAQHLISAKPIYPDLPSNTHNNDSNKKTNYKNAAAPLFEDVKLNKHGNQFISPADQQKHSVQSKISTPIISRQQANSSHMLPRHNSNEHISDESDQQNTPDINSDDVFLLIDAHEHLTVNNEVNFIRQLNSSSQDPSVKCVSIIGNTGDGKSFTLNQVFFNGQEKFNTSATTDSCTMGVWSALDESQRTLVLDTEGRLGLSQNDNTRNRLLLKILCISDIVIFRSRAPRLPNDMFQFLSDASNAFLKYFRKELENVMKSCKVDGPMSTMGPTLIVFHETQHTEVLRDHFECQKTAVEQLKERFEKMNLSYDAYSSIEYVGTQTLGGKQTDFSEIKATITAILENNKIRSPRRLSVIFKALKALNAKFNHAIPPDMPSTLPDDFFTCCIKCISCGAKCKLASNHQKENTVHECDEKCSYNKELNNAILKCSKCDREGRDTTVLGKYTAANDSLVEGMAKYIWSGFVIECSLHGEIYRSRKYWYGNSEPNDVTRVEIIHVWPGDDTTRLPSDVTPRKIVEGFLNASRLVGYISPAIKDLRERAADQIAPPYWVPNKDVHECSKCKLKFGSDYSKHHCRACGNIFCDTCTTHRIVVPLLPKKTPKRVCDSCYQKLQSQTISPMFENNDSSTQRTDLTGHEASNNTDSANNGLSPSNSYSRDLLDLVVDTVVPVAYDYSIKLIKNGTLPSYWQPDSECHACFVCKHQFNTTTHRLHHCRKCGKGVCDLCSPNKYPVPERDWLTPQRVCTLCEEIIKESNSEHN